MRKNILFSILVLLCAAASAQEPQKMVSYYPTPYAVYNTINANEVVINDPATNQGSMSAASFNISSLNVGYDLALGQSLPVYSNIVEVGQNSSDGLAGGTVISFLLRLNSSLAPGPIIKTAQLHLIDTWFMHDANGKITPFPYPLPALPSARSMIWKTISYPDDQLNTYDPSWKLNKKGVRGFDVPGHQAKFLVLNPNCQTGSTGWSKCMPTTVDHCERPAFLLPDGTTRPITGDINQNQKPDTCDGNSESEYQCKGNEVKTCNDVSRCTCDPGSTSTTTTEPKPANYIYSVGVLVNYTASPFKRATLGSTCVAGQKFDCHTGGDNADTDPQYKGRGWDSVAAMPFSGGGINTAQRLACNPWSLEFYVGPNLCTSIGDQGGIATVSAKMQNIGGKNIQTSEAMQKGWNGGKIIGTMFLGNFPALSGVKNFGYIGSIPVCPQNLDMGTACKQQGDYRCVYAVRLPASKPTRVWSGSITDSSGIVSKAYSCQDQEGKAIIFSCQDLNPAQPQQPSAADIAAFNACNDKLTACNAQNAACYKNCDAANQECNAKVAACRQQHPILAPVYEDEGHQVNCWDDIDNMDCSYFKVTGKKCVKNCDPPFDCGSCTCSCGSCGSCSLPQAQTCIGGGSMGSYGGGGSTSGTGYCIRQVTCCGD